MIEKMNPEVRALWVERLRTPGLPQTRGTLERLTPGGDGAPVGQCCLGVLCQIAVEQGLEIEAFTRSHNDGSLVVAYTHVFEDGSTMVESGLLPPAVADWAGIHEQDPNVIVKIEGIDVERQLAPLNDNGTTFAEIADLIEACL